MQGSVSQLPLFGFIYLFLSPRSPPKSYQLATELRGRAVPLWVRLWSCKWWSVGPGNKEEEQKQVQIHFETEGSLQRQAFKKQMKGGAIYCRTGAAASDLNHSVLVLWSFLPLQNSQLLLSQPLHCVSVAELTGKGLSLLQHCDSSTCRPGLTEELPLFPLQCWPSVLLRC